MNQNTFEFSDAYPCSVQETAPDWLDQIVELRDLRVEEYQGISHSDRWLQGLGVQRYVLDLNLEDYLLAPQVVRDLMIYDLGIQPDMCSSLDLNVHHYERAFSFSLKPNLRDITDDMIGILLTSNNTVGGIWAPVYDYSHDVKPIITLATFDRWHILKGRANDAFWKYRNLLAQIYEMPHPFDMPPANHTPIPVLMENIANWATALVEKRKIH